MFSYKILLVTIFIYAVSSKKLSSLDVSFQKGYEAYKGERWTECIAQFEGALHLYKLYRTIISNCRFKCNLQRYDSEITEDIEDLKVYEKFFNQRDCLIQCNHKEFENFHFDSNVHESILSNMETRRPYEYLHICYFQMYALPKAASAAYTFLVANPENKEMKQNLDYYLQQPEVDSKDIVDLESEDYEVLFNVGLKAYKQHNWRETIASMEESLSSYMSWENSCRSQCNRQPQLEWSSEYIITVSNILASVLHCKQQCQDRLKALHYSSGLEYIADLLNYIQISYYRLDRYEEAAKAVASYLLLLPQDEDMLENKAIYSTLTNETSFTIKSDVELYFKRDMYEKKLLDIFFEGNKNNIDNLL